MTFEILDRADSQADRELRIVTAAELHATTLIEEAEAEDGLTPKTEVDDFGLMTSEKSNVNITDDPTNQRLTMAEIEELKQDEMGRTKDLISKIMQSHTALDQKTAFSLAKYTLRKHRKYMKRFTVLPLDVATLTDYIMIEKEFAKIMEIRNEVIGLIGCWANIHASGDPLPTTHQSSRYLVVDDTGGLLVAAMAERMGILHQAHPSSKPETSDDEAEPEDAPTSVSQPSRPKRQHYAASHMSATSNTLTVVHSAQQPNLSLLRYFNFDSNNPTASHPLHSHLKTLSWLQLVEPDSDTASQEPPLLPPSEISKLKSNRRSNYFRKRRRWERTRAVIDDTRAGGFDGLVVASYTSPVSILQHLVPLLGGGAQVVVYSPHVEPLLSLTDYYSTARRTAFLSMEHSNAAEGDDEVMKNEQQHNSSQPIPEDFPLNPTLLLAPMVQTSRVRNWQVLPGRTHPVMTSKGGAEGYVWTSTRVIPAEGRVSARGKGRRNQNNAVVKKEGVVLDVEMGEDVEDDVSGVDRTRDVAMVEADRGVKRNGDLSEVSAAKKAKIDGETS